MVRMHENFGKYHLGSWAMSPLSRDARAHFYGFNRLEAAPEYTIEQWPAAVQVQSKHNTPIEGFWRWKHQGEGHSIHDAIFVGKSEGLFNPDNELHMCIFGGLKLVLLKISIAKLSIGCGPLLCKSSWMHSMTTGITIVFLRKCTRPYPLEHPLVKCGSYLSLYMHHLVTVPSMSICILCII
jgi:hypothetical protein